MIANDTPFTSAPTLADRLWLGGALAHGARHGLTNSQALVRTCGIGDHDWPAP